MTMALTLDEPRLKNLFPRASRSFIEANRALSNPEPQLDQKKSLVEAVPRKTESVRRIRVCFTLYRVRLLDDDGANASVKDLLDGLRHASILPDDNPGCIALTTQQLKVATYADERTEIEIEWP